MKKSKFPDDLRELLRVTEINLKGNSRATKKSEVSNSRKNNPNPGLLVLRESDISRSNTFGRNVLSISTSNKKKQNQIVSRNSQPKMATTTKYHHSQRK